MSDRSRAFFISLSVLALLLLSAFGTVPAYADDGTTTGSTDTTTSTGTDQGDTTTTTTEQAQPEAAPAPLLEQLPDNTTVTVVDETGEAQPLASTSSAEAVVLSDPIWCPATQTTPTPGANGCTISYGSFTDLLAAIAADPANYQVDGTIYVEQGVYLGGEESIDFNDTTFNATNLQQHNLTITGGWDTTTNTVTGTSEFNVPIILGSSSNPWAGSLTLNNLIINGVNQTGLTLYSDKNVTVSNVEVTDSLNGAEISAGGNVTVEKSKFHNNKNQGANITGGSVNVSESDFSNNGSGDIADPTGSGLGIKSSGAVTLADVAANNNQLSGATIEAGGAVNITRGFFNGNAGVIHTYNWTYKGYGLQVVTTGDISLVDVNANNNYLFGASLTGANVTVGKDTLPNSTFNNNGPANGVVGEGLTVKASSAVTLNNIEANGNQNFGANVNAGSSVVIRQSFFNGNQGLYVFNGSTYYGTGLTVVTPADIGLIDVTANDNNLLGAHLEGSDVIVNTGSFSNNGSDTGMNLIGKGLEIIGTNDVNFGKGDISLNNVTAYNNKEFGANIQTEKGFVAVSNSSFSGTIAYVYNYDTPYNNVSNKNGGYGLKVVAPSGNIDLLGVTADGNFLYGALLDGVNITVIESTFNSNGSGTMTYPVGYGLKVNSSGLVTLTDVAANYNQMFGADIKAAGNVDIGATKNPFSTFTGNQSVSFKPGSGLTFYGYGLTVYSENGDIVLNHVQGNTNNLWGGSLDGMTIVVLNSQFNNNVSDSSIFIDDTGLIINSRAVLDPNAFGDKFTVILDNVEAKQNRLIGVTINSVSGDVQVKNSTFTGNAGITCSISWCPPGSEIYWGYGLNVVTPGMISLSGVNASNNNLFGANLQGSTVNVSDSTFSNNAYGNGLIIKTTGTYDPATNAGNVTLVNVVADKNGLNGVDVTTVDPCANVKMTSGAYTNNAQYGLSVTGGSITFGGTNLSGNGVAGVFNNPGICVLPAATDMGNNNQPAAANVALSVTTSATTTTISANTTTTTTTVTNEKKVKKVKKAHGHKVKAVKVRHARNHR